MSHGHKNIEYYLNSCGLEKLVKKSNSLYASRCIICGDSEKNKSKRRLFFINKKEDWAVYCHNCGYSNNLKYFLSTINKKVYREYIKDVFLNRIQEDTHNCDYISGLRIDPNEFQFYKLNSPYIRSQKKYRFIIEKAEDFIKYRKIEHAYDKLYLSLNPQWFFKLIFPILDDKNKIYGFQARALSNIGDKYITHFSDETLPKMYNYFHVNKNENMFIVEGIIDSWALHNSIAMLSHSLHFDNTDLKLFKHNLVFVGDNDKTGRAQLEKYAMKGYKVAIWPDKYSQYKDTNAIQMDQHVNKDILTHEFSQNIAQGLKAKILLKMKANHE